MRSCLSASLLFLLFVAAPENTLCILRLTFNSIQCRSSPNYIANLTISIVNNAVNLDLLLVRSLTQGFKGNVNVQMRLAHSAKYQSIFSYDFDVCSIMYNVQKLKSIQKWYKKLLKFGNFMENCPISKGYYFLRNVPADTSNIPPYLQAGAYRIVVRTYFGKYKAKTYKNVSECFATIQLQ